MTPTSLEEDALLEVLEAEVPQDPAQQAGPAITASHFVKGGLWGVGGQVLTLALSLIATPFVIRLLGPTSYGILALVNVVIGYASLSDLGMGQASTKFGAEAFGRRDAVEESAVIWTALLVVIVPASLLSGAMFLSADLLATTLLHVPPDLHRAATIALQLAAVVLFVRSISVVLNTPHMVRLRQDLVSGINNGGGAIQVAFVPLVLWWLHGGVASAVAVFAIVGIGIAIAHAIVACYFLPALRVPRLAHGHVRAIVRYGWSNVALVIVSLVGFNAEKFMVSGFASADALAYYSVAFTLTRLLSVLPGAISPMLLPAFARLNGEGPRAPVQKLYKRSLRWLLLVNLPGAVIMIALAGPLLRAWAGADYAAQSALPTALLVIGMVANALCYVPMMLLQAIGRIDLIVRYFSLMLIPYLVGTALCVHYWGSVGAAAAWSVRAIAEYVLMARAARAASGHSPALKPTIARSLVPTLAMGALLVLAPAALTASIPGLLVTIAAASAVYALLAWLIVLTSDERHWLTHTVGGTLARLTRAAV